MSLEFTSFSTVSFKGIPSAAVVESTTKVDSQFFLRRPRVRLRRFPEEKCIKLNIFQKSVPY